MYINKIWHEPKQVKNKSTYQYEGDRRNDEHYSSSGENKV